MTTLVSHPAPDASMQRQRTGMYGALVAAGLLGLVVLYGVGFSPTPRVHDAAHDVRHATGMPCH